MRNSSISVAVLATAAMLAGLALRGPPDTPGKILLGGLFIVLGALVGLLWYWIYGSWFRDYFGLDREYRRIDDDTLAEIDRAEQQQFRLGRVLFGLLFLVGVPVSVGLRAVHYMQGACGSAWECFHEATFLDGWFWALFVLAAFVEVIEKLVIKPRRRPPAAS